MVVDGSDETNTDPCTNRFAAPKTNTEIIEARKLAIPQKTLHTTYCIRLFETWRKNRNQCHGSSLTTLQEMDLPIMAHWMSKFALEVRKLNGAKYQPNTLYHIICGIMRHIKLARSVELDFFKNPEFSDFRASLDGWMEK